MHYDVGYFDDETCRLEPIENPFGPKVLPMCSEYTVTHVTGIDRRRVAPQAGLEPATLRLTAGCSAIELLRNMETRGTRYGTRSRARFPAVA